MKNQNFDEPPADGGLGEGTEVSELIDSIKSDFDGIVSKGAFVFDIDETLMSPDASLKDETEVRDLLLKLLHRGVLIGLISGGPGTMVTHRIIDPLCEASANRSDFLSRFHVYANGGSSKYTLDRSGSFSEQSAYAEAHRIPGSHLYKIKELVEAYAQDFFGLGDLLPEVTGDWLRKRAEQWMGKEVHFDDGWIYSRPWKADLWDDATMARVKAGKETGRTTFPFINVRRAIPGRDARIESLSGISISGFYSLKVENGDSCDLDLRDQIIERLGLGLGEDAQKMTMKKAGRASIDITKAGTDKAAALIDFIAFWKCDPAKVFYFGDEFFRGGNDLPAAEAAGLSDKGIRLVALNRHLKPPRQDIIWAGRSCKATRELLHRLL